jgi:hypothetical protein
LRDPAQIALKRPLLAVTAALFSRYIYKYIAAAVLSESGGRDFHCLKNKNRFTIFERWFADNRAHDLIYLIILEAPESGDVVCGKGLIIFVAGGSAKKYHQKYKNMLPAHIS